jgi:uncharacterized phiE125 gp8 family phage protein
MNRILLTPPPVEPVNLSDTKEHLVIDSIDYDAMLLRLITAARRHIENRTGRAIVRQQWRVYHDAFVEALPLLPASVQEVVQVQYTDTNGVVQTVPSDVYELDRAGQVLRLAAGKTWPAVVYRPNAVWVDVYAGFYDPAASPMDLLGHVPGDLQAAILMLVEDLFEHRGTTSEIVLFKNATAAALWQPYRVLDA